MIFPPSLSLCLSLYLPLFIAPHFFLSLSFPDSFFPSLSLFFSLPHTSLSIHSSHLSVLVGLYEEPERPPNAVDYIKRYMGAPTGVDVEALRRHVHPCIPCPYVLTYVHLFIYFYFINLMNIIE